MDRGQPVSRRRADAGPPQQTRYRQMAMSTSDDDLEMWADWFKCLADPTRLKILHHVASLDQPVTVGDIVDIMGKSQSTVSRHLQVLAAQRFIFTDVDGTRTLIRPNERCMVELPQAAAAVMGQAVSAASDC